MTVSNTLSAGMPIYYGRLLRSPSGLESSYTYFYSTHRIQLLMKIKISHFVRRLYFVSVPFLFEALTCILTDKKRVTAGEIDTWVKELGNYSPMDDER